MPLHFSSHLAFSGWKKLKKPVLVSSMEPLFMLYKTVLQNSALTLWAQEVRKQISPCSVKVTENCASAIEILSMLSKHFTQCNWNSSGSQIVHESCYSLTPRDILACFLYHFFSTWVKRVWGVPWSHSLQDKKTKDFLTPDQVAVLFYTLSFLGIKVNLDWAFSLNYLYTILHQRWLRNCDYTVPVVDAYHLWSTALVWVCLAYYASQQYMMNCF